MESDLKTVKNQIFSTISKIHKVQIKSQTLFVFLQVIKFVFGVCTILFCRFNAWSTFFPSIARIQSYIFLSNGGLNPILDGIGISLVIILIGYISLMIKISFQKSNESSGILQNICAWLTAFLNFLSVPFVFLSTQLIINGIINDNKILAITGTILSLILILLSLFLQRFYINYKFLYKNIFSKLYSNEIFISKVLYLIIIIFLSIRQIKLLIEIQICCIVIIIACFLKIYNNLYGIYYSNYFVQKTNLIEILLQLNIMFIFSIDGFLSQDLIKYNFIVSVLFLTIFQFLAIDRYKSYRKQNLILQNPQKIKNQQNSLFYLKGLFQYLKKAQDSYNQLILASLKKDHLINCNKVQCYCKRQNEDKMNSPNFIKQFILQRINCLLNQTQSLYLIQIIGCFFKLQSYQIYPKLLYLLKKLPKDKLNTIQLYAKYCLQIQIKQLITQKNIKIKSLDAQGPIKLQQILHKIENKTLQTCQSQQKKYRYLSKGLCRVTQIKIDCNIQLKLINQIIQIYQNNIKRFKKSLQFNSSIYFYFHKVIMVNFSFLSLQKNIMEIDHQFKITQLVNLKDIAKTLYSPNSCSVISTIDPENMGKVLQTSKNFETMFLMNKTSIIGKNINTIIPKFLANQHDKILIDWLKTGIWKSIGKLQQVICQKKQKLCFSAVIYIKLHIQFDHLNFVATIFKKSDDQILIINKASCVEYMSDKFQQIIGKNCYGFPLEFIIDKISLIKSLSQVGTKRQMEVIIFNMNNAQNLIQNYLEDNQNGTRTKNSIFANNLKQLSLDSYIATIEFTKWNMRQKQMIIIKLKNYHQLIESETKRAQKLTPTKSIDILQDNSQKDLCQFNKIKKNNKYQILENNNASTTSTYQSQNYILNKMITTSLEYFVQPSAINNQFFKCSTILVIIVIICFFIIISGSWYFSFIGINQLQNIVQAQIEIDGNIKLLQFLYNNVIILKQYENNLQNYQNFIKYGHNIKNQFYGKFTEDIINIFNKVVYPSGKYYFNYLIDKQNWIFSSNLTASIQIIQFLELFYYTAKQTLINGPNKQMLLSLYNNFNKLQQIQSNNLNNFMNIGTETSSFFKNFYLSHLCAFAVLSLILGLIFHKFCYYRHQQENKSLKIYGFLTTKQISYLKTYYQKLYGYTNMMIHSSSKLDIGVEDINLDIDTQSTQLPKLKFIQNKPYQSYKYIIILLLIINSVNILLGFNNQSTIQVSQKVANLINNMLKSQNNLINTYFELKSFYILEDTNQSIKDILNRNYQRISKDQIPNNQDFQNLLLMAIQFDGGLTADEANGLLIQDLCNFTSIKLIRENSNLCQDQYYKIPKMGVYVSIKYFKTQLLSLLEISQKETQLTRQYFLTNSFQDLQKSLIINFAVYKEIIKLLNNSMKQSIQIKFSIAQKIQLSQIILFLIIIIFWFIYLNFNKIALAQLYGHFLLIPTRIVKENKKIIQNVEANLGANI